MDEHSEAKSKIAQEKPRDSHGHFVKEVLQKPAPPQSHTKSQENLLEKLVPTHVEVDHNVSQDDLLDVHLGNPLRKITAILEEIKAQKAFSFTLKGSLSIAGVVLTLSVFGFFGGSKILSDKGEQTITGTIKQLDVVTTPPQIPILTTIINSFNYIVFHRDWPTGHPRFVLVDLRDATTNAVEASTSDVLPFVNKVVYVTGKYDSCSRILKASEPKAIEEIH